MDNLYELERQLAETSDNIERVKLLNELSLALSRIDPIRGLEYSLDADMLAEKCGDIAGRAESFRVAAWCQETLCEYDTAIEFAYKGRELFRQAGERNGEGKCLNAIGVIAYARSQFSTALEALNEARIIFAELGNNASLASAYNNSGMIYQELGNYPEALAAYLEALRINEELGDESQVAVNIGNVSNIYYYLGDLDRSFEYDKRSLEVARQQEDHYGIAHALESISSNYKAREEYAAAFEALNEALVIFRELHERRYEAAALIKLGTLYELQNDPRSALEAYKEGEKIARAIRKKDLSTNAQLHIGRLHVQGGRYKSAIPILRTGLANARKGDILKLKSELLLTLADALDAVDEYAEASACRKEYALLLEKLYGEERQRAVAEMQARFEIERAEREGEVLRLRNGHLEEMMELRSRELTSMAMRLVRNNAFLQKLRKETLQLAADYPESKGVLDRLLKEIVQNIHGDNEWERFEQEFQLIHHDFLTRLSQRCPRLTPAELKVCAMLKINLSNKEMANLLSVSTRNIESHRYAIRKKLELPSETNLTIYLVGL